MKEMRIMTIGEVCATSSDTYRAKADEVTLINTSDVLEGKVLNHMRVPNKELKGQFKKTFKRNDILYSEIRPQNKRFAFVDFDPVDYIASTKLMVLRADTTKVLPMYLYFYLKSAPVIAELQMLAETRSGTFPQITFTELSNLTIPVPSIEEQETIVATIKCLEDKIDCNTSINDNLQQQMQALYRSWFIEYTPFGGTAPDDWRCGKLKDILQLQKRAIKAGSAPELPYLPIDTIPMKTFAVSDFRPNEEAQSSLIKFNKDDIVIGAMRVYFHRVIIAPCDGITRSTCFVLRPSSPAYLSFGLLTCDLDSSIDHAQNTSKGSTMPYAVWDGGMGEIEITIPPLTVAKEFNELALPMLRQIQNSYYEVKALRELRDSLLPRLMSGELDIGECF